MTRAENWERIEEEAALDASLRQLTAPLAVVGGKTALLAASGDPLLNVCQEIGKIQGITFRPSRDKRDPVASLCRISGAKCRRVVLDGLLFRPEGQPLLAFRESDERPVALLPRRSRGYYVYDPVEGSRTKAVRSWRIRFSLLAIASIAAFRRSR